MSTLCYTEWKKLCRWQDEYNISIMIALCDSHEWHHEFKYEMVKMGSLFWHCTLVWKDRRYVGTAKSKVGALDLASRDVVKNADYNIDDIKLRIVSQIIELANKKHGAPFQPYLFQEQPDNLYQDQFCPYYLSNDQWIHFPKLSATTMKIARKNLMCKLLEPLWVNLNTLRSNVSFLTKHNQSSTANMEMENHNTSGMIADLLLAKLCIMCYTSTDDISMFKEVFNNNGQNDCIHENYICRCCVRKCHSVAYQEKHWTPCPLCMSYYSRQSSHNNHQNDVESQFSYHSEDDIPHWASASNVDSEEWRRGNATLEQCKQKRIKF